MKHRGIRTTLLIIEACIGLGAIGGGIAILTGAFALWLPVTLLQGTPFSDYTIPGLVLLIVVGGGMLLAAGTQFIQRAWVVLLSAAMGLVMLGWELVEIAIIDRHAQAVVPSTVIQQVLFSALGIVIFGLAVTMWMAEYRGQRVPTRDASHA